MNGLRLFDPTLIGYREMSRVWNDVVSGQDEVSVDGLGWWPGKWKMGMSSFGSKESESSMGTVKDGEGEVEEEPATTADEHTSDAEDTPLVEEGDATSATPYVMHTESPLPKHYIDLRFGGLGFVLDLGWRRTDEGLRWEVEDTLRAAALNRPAAPAKKDVLDSTEPQRAQHSGWLRSSFVSSW